LPTERRPVATVWSPLVLDQTFSVERPSLYAASSAAGAVRTTDGRIVFATGVVETVVQAAAAGAARTSARATATASGRTAGAC
jgi:hypothetical protein